METIKSGRMTYSKHKPIESVIVFIRVVLWLCLVLMPWLLLAVLSHVTGIVELSSLELKTTVFALLGSAIQIILYSQK
jgi:hypothetical protein